MLSEADVVDVTVSLAQWPALGLVLTGVVFAYYRRRAHPRAGGDAPGSFGTNALYGAVVAAALSFVPTSTVRGGAAAAYLDGDREGGAKTRAVTGAVSAIPSFWSSASCSSASSTASRKWASPPGPRSSR